MSHHLPLTLPPVTHRPDEPWALVERGQRLQDVGAGETLFALTNGYLGLRGTMDEGRPTHAPGALINGFYESWDIVHAESAYGFATSGQTIVTAPDATPLRLFIDDEPFHCDTATILDYERRLDFATGVMRRTVVYQTPRGGRVRITSERLVSAAQRHLAAICYRVELLDEAAPLVVTSEIHDAPVAATGDEGDPRGGRRFEESVLVRTSALAEGPRVVSTYHTRASDMRLACGMDHVIECAGSYRLTSACDASGGYVTVAVDATPQMPVTITKYLAYHTSHAAAPEDLARRAARTLSRAREHGFAALVASQEQTLADFWATADVIIDTDEPRIQQAVRWNLFQVFQNSIRAERHGIPAKGLTGAGYDGHYFWDMEMYLMPALSYTLPAVAGNLLRFRHSLLDAARERARMLAQRGALFPWRTISGEEASAYYEASTAQYHINADIIHALKKYVLATGDVDLLDDIGAEMLVETARLWLDLGFFHTRAGRSFRINGVTGPDEYTTLVNNNTYTNLMARKNLRWAADVLEELRERRPERYAALAAACALDDEEPVAWRDAGDHMYIPYDPVLGIHPQDDDFLDKEIWDFAATPAEHYPLLLHYHPLVIYRHQVIKQADIILAMSLYGREFSLEQKRRNFEYYDPLTTGDSSLSACVQAIVAAEIGYHDTAYEYFRRSLFMDLADAQQNTADGVHVAAAGGTWMALVHGFAGMRDDRGELSFAPALPAHWRSLTFALCVQGQRVRVHLEPGTTTYTLMNGESLTIVHRGQRVELQPAIPVALITPRTDSTPASPAPGAGLSSSHPE